MDSVDQPQFGGAEAPREEWIVSVLTGVRRAMADLTVAVDGTDVVVVPPPGEGYVIPLGSFPKYFEALQAAYGVADRRRRGRRPDSQLVP